jgi:hypothetical protein
MNWWDWAGLAAIVVAVAAGLDIVWPTPPNESWIRVGVWFSIGVICICVAEYKRT